MSTTTAVDIRDEAEKLLRLVETIDGTIEEAAAQARRIDDLGQEGGQLQRLAVSVSEEARSLAALIAMEDDTYTPGLAAREARDLLDLIDLARCDPHR